MLNRNTSSVWFDYFLVALCAFALAAPALVSAQEPPPEPSEVPEKIASEEPEESVDESSDAEIGAGVVAVEPDPESFKVKWADFKEAALGLTDFTFADGRLRFRTGLHVQADGTLFRPLSELEQALGVRSDERADFRRIRINAEGIWKTFHFSASFDLGADIGLKDAWLEKEDEGLRVWGVHLGKLRMGQMKEPFSLSRQMASNDLPMLEWGLPVSTFAPGRNVGVMIHDSGKRGRGSWAAGVFSFGQKAEDNASNSVFSITGRATYLLISPKESDRLLHVGASFSTRSPRSDEVRFEARPEARFAPFLVDTGKVAARGETLIGLEMAGVKDSAWFQTEVIRTDLDSESIGDPSFWGGYIEVGWNLTGEVRRYEPSNGTFHRVVPTNPYSKGNPFKKGNGGAWEVVLRASTVDLDSGPVEGGKMTNIGVGVNWFPTTKTRVMLNYIRSDVKDVGAANVFIMRFVWVPW
ncbi:MAG: hypothetical protein GY906_16810 [bacterium]|nr:hypothetical protein [bacterium]